MVGDGEIASSAALRRGIPVPLAHSLQPGPPLVARIVAGDAANPLLVGCLRWPEQCARAVVTVADLTGVFERDFGGLHASC